MATSPFDSAEQEIQELAKEAFSTRVMKAFVANNPSFTQKPPTVGGGNTLARYSHLHGKLVQGSVWNKHLLTATGILVGFAKVEPRNTTSPYAPVIYTVPPKLTDPGTHAPLPHVPETTPAQIRKRFVLLGADTVRPLTSLHTIFDTICKYLEGKGYKKMPQSHGGSNFIWEIFAMGEYENDTALYLHVRSDTAKKNVTFGYAVMYPGCPDWVKYTRHAVGISGDQQERALPSVTDSGMQDIIPGIDFGEFTSTGGFKPTDIDDFKKAFLFYTDITLKSTKGRMLASSLLSSGRANTLYNIEQGKRIEFDDLRFKLMYLMTAWGTITSNIQGVNFIFYDNELLQTFVDTVGIPDISGMNTEEYDTWVQADWYKYAIVKLLLPPFFMEYKDKIVLPAEAYLHHKSIQAKIGKVGAPKGFDEAKIQCQLRAFMGAINTVIRLKDRFTPERASFALRTAIER